MLRRGAFAIPPAPLALTVAGLMPFFGGALAAFALGDDPAPQAGAHLTLLVYSAVILSFLGGVRWGVEMNEATFTPPRWGIMTGSIIGALVGWGAVVYYLLGTPAQSPWVFVAMACALFIQWIWDVLSRRDTPAWYDGLRTIASTGAVGSLLTAWVSTGIPGF
ncbi:MAG: DUF3429 domain-containing protein [Pseudomonadota bacterium]